MINLAGENPAGIRWTDAKKKRILDSRIRSIEVLTSALDKIGRKDIAFLQSSGTGIYGSRKDEVLTEEV